MTTKNPTPAPTPTAPKRTQITFSIHDAFCIRKAIGLGVLKIQKEIERERKKPREKQKHLSALAMEAGDWERLWQEVKEQTEGL